MVVSEAQASKPWRGFLIESKEFMSYDKMTIFEKLWFWVRYPLVHKRFKKLVTESERKKS